MERIYLCIDLKSFYASVECRDRNLDPLKTNLVVADNERTEKTICLAVSPSLKKLGLSGRARLFEVVQKLKEVNYKRLKENKIRKFISKSYDEEELNKHKNYEIDYIVAKPRMGMYLKYSALIYNVYLKFLSPDDIYVYSIDEVFCDITNYLKLYKLTPKQLASKMIQEVYNKTGITATAGIGTNMYLAKVAMDIVAKHAEPNEIGVRVAELNEKTYREILWKHKPLTSFWRVGPGIAKKLEANRMYTMGDVARCSIVNEPLLFKLFGVNAELLIDHAWGYEPTTIEDVKNYKPERNSMSQGQVLHCAYNYEDTKLIVREMIDQLSLKLVEKNLITNQLVLTIGYDVDNLKISSISRNYFGEVVEDHYGRQIPKHSHGTINIGYKTSSSKVLTKKCIELFEKIINKNLLVRRINITACNIVDSKYGKSEVVHEQLNLFDNDIEKSMEDELEKSKQEEELKLQKVVLEIKNKYGKNAVLKGMNLEKASTTIDRNNQIGGHSA